MKISLHGQLARATFLSCVALVLKAVVVGGVDARQVKKALRLASTDIPEVYHDKHPGGHYKRGSPLYQGPAGVTPVSTTMKCIIFLILQFFAVYTSLFVVQTIMTFRPKRLTRLEKVLTGVAKTVYMIPMLCVLFLATRMRAVQLSKGMTSQYGLPQMWVRYAMIICVMAHMMRTATDAVSRALPSQGPGGAVTMAKSPMRMREKALKVVFHLFTVVHHVCFMLVCFGLCSMPAPKELWGSSGGPKASVAVFCTIVLLTLFFVVHFIIDVLQNLDDLYSQGRRFSRLAMTNLFRDMPLTVDIIPMLCVLFVATRIRSWQMSGTAIETWPNWAKTAAYVATFTVFAMVALSVAVAVLRKEPPPGPSAENEAPRTSSTWLGKLLNLSRLAMLLTLCSSAVLITLALFTFRLPNGTTPLMPSSIQCVLCLTILYFLFYFAKYVVETLQLYVRSERKAQQLQRLLKFLEDHSKKAIDFCPVLSALFLASFLRALQITDGRGAPQRWAQHWMYVATWAVIFMTIARVDSLLFPTANEGKVSRSQFFFKALLTVSMVLLHVAVFAIIVAVFTITPANAHGRGSIDVI